MDSKAIASQLKAVDLFAELSDKVRDRIARSGHVVGHPAGKVVVEEGGRAVGFHLVLEGGGHLVVPGVREAEVGVGDYFGEISLIDGKPRTATVTAGPAGMTTFALTSWEFAAILDERPEVARAMLRTLCARIRATTAAVQRS